MRRSQTGDWVLVVLFLPTLVASHLFWAWKVWDGFERFVAAHDVSAEHAINSLVVRWLETVAWFAAIQFLIGGGRFGARLGYSLLIVGAAIAIETAIGVLICGLPLDFPLSFAGAAWRQLRSPEGVSWVLAEACVFAFLLVMREIVRAMNSRARRSAAHKLQLESSQS